MSSRGTWVFRDGKLVKKEEALHADYMQHRHARSALPSPGIISDTLKKEFVSNFTGKPVSSRSAWLREVKANGYEVVGSDNPASFTSKPISEERYKRDLQKDIATSLEKVEQGYKPAPGPEMTAEETAAYEAAKYNRAGHDKGSEYIRNSISELPSVAETSDAAPEVKPARRSARKSTGRRKK